MLLGFCLLLWLGFLVFDILRRRNPAMDLREIILIEAILVGAAIVPTTEILSAFQALVSGVVLLWWGAICVVLHRYRLRLPAPPPLDLKSRWVELYRESSWGCLALILAMAVFTLVLFVVALVATPNNYDSMTYHLARMGHWLQNESISFYGTNNPRQNYPPPWAEWVMLQLTLLQGNDQLVNLLQWACYVGCMIGAALVTELLGGTRRDGLIAAFFVATLPAATFEATSTQNDLVMSFWLICIVYGCVRLTARPGWREALIFGASVGLAILSKTVTLIFALPLCLWATWALIRPSSGNPVPKLAVIALIVLSLNAGHFARNLAASGNPLGPDEHEASGSTYLNDIHTPGAIFSNVLRNVSLHANLFHEKSVPEEWVITVLTALGIDPNDPRTTFNGSTFSIWEGGEDGAPMPFHLALIALCAPFLFRNYRRFGFMPLALALCVAMGAFLFCVILKWQPFHARLHLALFILSAPFVALVMGRVTSRRITWAILLLFLLTSLPNVFWYPPRPALGPLSIFTTSDDFQQLFRQPELVSPYLQAKQILAQANVQKVGLIWKEDDWEYPLLVSHHEPVPWQVEHVLINNAYSPLETTMVPDALLCTRSGLGASIVVHGQSYHLIHAYVASDDTFILSIYLLGNAPPNPPP